MFRGMVVRLCVVLIVASMSPCVLIAEEAPPTAEQVRQLMAELPLSVETWPQWRDYYVRLYFADVDSPDEFTDLLREFHNEDSEAAKPAEWESDPVVWVIRSGELRKRGYEAGQLGPAVDASRKALSLGDPEGMSSVCLASSLISQAVVSLRGTNQLPAESRPLLTEAEQLLTQAAMINPEASFSAWRGLIARVRGDEKEALELLRQAANERPNTPWITGQYLSLALGGDADQTIRKSDLTRPAAERFPESAEILMWHAAALFHDHEFPAAAAALEQSRKFGDDADKYFPKQYLQDIEANGSLGPQAVEGLKAFDEKRYADAIKLLREAWKENQRTQTVARVLLFALLNSVTGKLPVASLVGEMGELVAAYPGDGQMQAGYAVALASADRFREAQQAMDRARQAGFDPSELITAEGLREIRRRADAAANEDAVAAGVGIAGLTSAGVAAGVLIWIGVMFVAGAILAVLIPRVPDAALAAGELKSGREIWLERFYLLVLSIGLLVFYISVPFVVVGILVVTLALVFALLLGRILHYGLLYRGGWAAWHMVRCIFWGPSDDVFGIEIKAEEHPRLFDELHAVAERIQTAPVDKVFLVPGAQVSVSQEGTGPFGLFGRRRRVLHVGISVLPWLSTSEFRSILAHEYGHFSHSDPFFGRFIFQVSNSLAHSLGIMRAAAGWLNYINPFYGVYWLYLRAYALLSAGYSRSREFLADRRAVLAYGKKPFVSGLTKICEESDLFDSFAFQNIHEQLVKGNALANVFDSYREYRILPEASDVRGKYLSEAREQKPGWFDSHPTFSERIAAVDCFEDGAAEPHADSARNLLTQPEALEESLTKLMTERVHQLVIEAS